MQENGIFGIKVSRSSFSQDVPTKQRALLLNLNDDAASVDISAVFSGLKADEQYHVRQLYSDNATELIGTDAAGHLVPPLDESIRTANPLVVIRPYSIALISIVKKRFEGRIIGETPVALTISPNPVSQGNDARLQADNTTTEDIQGKLYLVDKFGNPVNVPQDLALHPGTQQIQLDISSLPSGVYACVFECEGGISNAVFQVLPQ